MKTKKIYFRAAILFIFTVPFMFLFTAANEPAEHSYVGVKDCAGTCHKGDSKGNQLEIWQNSKHSQAFKNLQTPEADAIAKEKGFSTPAAETPECVKCHTLGNAFTSMQFENGFEKSDGVQCETCHGPGSDYKKLSVMKDRNLAVQNGLTIHENDMDSFCKSCHNPESPTYKEFVLEEFWGKIKHPKP